MKLSQSNIKLIFGLKVKQLRQNRNLSLSELAKKAGLSVSYLNEIESGKKYPKSDKIAALAKALEIDYDNLVSLKLGKSLAPLGDLMDSKILEKLPLDHYGIDINKLIVLLSNAPVQLNALVATLIELAKSTEMSDNKFSRTALRIYKELHDNYFEKIEKSVDKFIAQNKLTGLPIIHYNDLLKILTQKYNYEIDEKNLEKYELLSEIRGIAILGKSNRLIINPKLKPPQKTYLLAKEIAYNFLNIKDRAVIYSNRSLDSFDHLLNNYMSSYFANALIIRRDLIINTIKDFFKQEKWSGGNLLKLIDNFNSTPEMFFHRLTNLSSKYLKLNKLFFLRFATKINNDKYNLSKEFRLNIDHYPGGYQTGEHYCRRWIAINVLEKLKSKIKSNPNYSRYIVGIQISKFGYSNDKYLAISIGRRSTLTPDNLSSVTIGYLIDENLTGAISFINDSKIKTKIVNDTCERCSINNCQERMAAPVVLEKEAQSQKVGELINQLMQNK